MTNIHLTQSKYVITSYLNFDQYYNGFSYLKDFTNKLLQEVQKLSETEMPYFIQRYSGKQQVLEDIFKTHKSEVMSLIDTLEALKFQFNKILDHMTTSADMKSDKQSQWQVKRGAIHKIFNFLFGSGDDNSETIRKTKCNLGILEQKQKNVGRQTHKTIGDDKLK